MGNIKIYLTERLIDLTKLQKKNEEAKQSKGIQKQADNKLQGQQDNRSWFQQQAKAEAAKSIYKTLEGITAREEDSRLEIKREKIRIRGKVFEKWQRERDKIEENRAKNAEIEMKRNMAEEKEREKSQIQCEADWMK